MASDGSVDGKARLPSTFRFEESENPDSEAGTSEAGLSEPGSAAPSVAMAAPVKTGSKRGPQKGQGGAPKKPKAELKPKAKPEPQGKRAAWWHFRLTASKVHGEGEDLEELFTKHNVAQYGFQKERGDKGQHILHFQCTLQVLEPLRFTQVRDMLKEMCDIEDWSGSEAYLMPTIGKAANKYAMKSETRVDGPWFKGETFAEIAKQTVYKIEIELQSWQKRTCAILDTPPDDRFIWWLWEPYGGLGKTTFQKWIYQNYKGVMISGGKAADMKPPPHCARYTPSQLLKASRRGPRTSLRSLHP